MLALPSEIPGSPQAGWAMEEEAAPEQVGPAYVQSLRAPLRDQHKG